MCNLLKRLTLTAASFYDTAGYPAFQPSLSTHLNTISMKIHMITVRLEIRLGCEKSKPVKVAPYIRIRNGKKELVRGYKKKK